MNYSNTYDVIILINEQTRSTCRLQMNMARSPNVFFFFFDVDLELFSTVRRARLWMSLGMIVQFSSFK